MTKNTYIVQNIEKGIWKIPAGSNIYLLRLDEPIVIDAGDRRFRREAGYIERIIDPRDVKKVIFTHFHYDHIGNFDMFPNAEFYASEEEIALFKKDPEKTVLNKDMAEKFKAAISRINPSQKFEHPKIKIINTPGHTKGSICVYYKEKKMLFSGDTLFPDKKIGRTDFPTSSSADMQRSLMVLIGYPFDVLCPGHD